MGYLIGVDIGGTFTDAAIVDELGVTTVGKAPTTPSDPSDGFFAALQSGAQSLGLSLGELLRATERLAHGTTVAINAVVTRSGARVGMLATAGHGDTIKIMENVGRSTGVPIETRMHYPRSRLPDPFVQADLIREVRERVDQAGDVVVALCDEDVSRGVAELLEGGVEAIAVVYLWSFMNPQHELRTERIISDIAPELPVSLSHRVAPKVGEFPRMATTILNSYVQPIMRDYTKEIERRALELGYAKGVMFMQCEGGLADGERARTMAVRTLQSGPVGGVVGSATFAAKMGRENVITTDVGGTTLDVSVISKGRPVGTGETIIEQHELFLNMVEVESIGAGGGSVGWYDEFSGSLRVGPQSAGADPGPACYGRGGVDPTVCDADLILGILDPERFLGGRLPLHIDRARAAMAPLADRLNMSIEECAAGMVEVVNARMSDLIRRMTLQRGLDPRDFVIYAYGGGGGAHASLYARGLGVRQFVVPQSNAASVWSALGIAVADVVGIFEQPIYLEAPFDPEAVADALEQIESQARDQMDRDHPLITDWRFERLASCKYGMQVFEVEAEMPSGPITAESLDHTVANFEAAYAERFGAEAGYRDAGVQLTRVGLRVQGQVRKPRLRGEERACAPAPDSAWAGERPVYWVELGGRQITPIWDGPSLSPGHQLDGPAIVELPNTTVVVRPGGSLEVDMFGNYVVQLEREPIRESAKQAVDAN